jgi:hypothetical protein
VRDGDEEHATRKYRLFSVKAQNGVADSIPIDGANGLKREHTKFGSGVGEILVEKFGRHMIDAGGGASCRV